MFTKSARGEGLSNPDSEGVKDSNHEKRRVVRENNNLAIPRAGDLWSKERNGEDTFSGWERVAYDL
jgi:hypothetical protein